MCFDLEGNNGIPVKSCNKPHFCEYHPLDLSTHSPRMKSCPIREQKDPPSRSEGRGGQLCAHCALHYAYLDSFPLIHRPCLGYGGWGNNTGRRRCKSLNEMEMDLRNSRQANLDGNRIYSISVQL